MGPPASSDQAFCLKLNSHQNHLVSAFQRLYNDEILTDCTISCQGGTIKVHKLVLSACSPYFTDLFAYFSNPNQYPIIILKDMAISDLEAIVEFMYNGEVIVPHSSLSSVLDSAKALMIIGLSDIKIETGSRVNESSKRKGKRRRRSRITKENKISEDEEYSESETSDSGSQIKNCSNGNNSQEVTKTSEMMTENYQIDQQTNIDQFADDSQTFFIAPEDSNSSPPGPSTDYHRPICKLSPTASFKANLRQLRIEKIQHSTGGLSGRKIWSESETSTLVDVWDEESARIWASANKKILSLQRISDLLQQRNVDRDVSQVEGKIKALKRDFKAVKLNRAIPSVQIRMAPHLDKLESIFLREEL